MSPRKTRSTPRESFWDGSWSDDDDDSPRSIHPDSPFTPPHDPNLRQAAATARDDVVRGWFDALDPPGDRDDLERNPQQ